MPLPSLGGNAGADDAASYATLGSNPRLADPRQNPRLADTVPGRSATHTFEPHPGRLTLTLDRGAYFDVGYLDDELLVILQNQVHGTAPCLGLGLGLAYPYPYPYPYTTPTPTPHQPGGAFVLVRETSDELRLRSPPAKAGA